jgi:ADP-ribosyl-[dinitrogen reductase] hydrolase
MALVNPGDLLQAVVGIVEQEGARLREEFLKPEGPRGREATAPIDTEIEQRLQTALQALLHCDFIGEETGRTPGTVEGWLWLVDPHDATMQFLEGRRGSAVSVALLKGALPVLGVVHSPLSPDRGADTIAWAEGCSAVLRNGLPVDADLSGRALAAREFVWATTSSARRPETYSRAASPARYVAMPSIAYRLARVAAGDGVAAISIHSISEYDIAAGAALLRGAGGVVLDAEGKEVVFTGAENARVSACYGGAPSAVAALARRDWSALQQETRRPERTPAGFPAVSDDIRLSRASGCLLGQVAGDSLGSLVEFRSANEIARDFPAGVRELADGGTWGLIAGQPTDDSELALALARTLVREHGFEPLVVREAYRHWLASEPVDVGATTRRGLLGQADLGSESNGSLMRVSPIGVWGAGDVRLATRAARDDSRLTHPNPVCVEACAAYVAAIATGVAGGAREEMIAAALDAIDPGARTVRAAIVAGVDGVLPDFETSQGWVLIALQNAFHRLAHAPDFEQGLVATVSAGGDTDTNGAIAGALLGALHGREAVPMRWILPVLACRPLAEADAFRPRPVEYWPDDVLELAEALLRIGRRT